MSHKVYLAPKRTKFKEFMIRKARFCFNIGTLIQSQRSKWKSKNLIMSQTGHEQPFHFTTTIYGLQIRDDKSQNFL